MANEKRLIDLDKLVENFKATKLSDCFPDWDDMIPQATVAVLRMLRAYREIVLNQPIVDAVEVVRCRDCQWARPLNRKDSYEDAFVEGCIWCRERQDGVMPDDYCSDGKSTEL